MASDQERVPGSALAKISQDRDILAKDPNCTASASPAEARPQACLRNDTAATDLEGLKFYPDSLGGYVARSHDEGLKSHPNHLGDRIAFGRHDSKEPRSSAAVMKRPALEHLPAEGWRGGEASIGGPQGARWRSAATGPRSPHGYIRFQDDWTSARTGTRGFLTAVSATLANCRQSMR